jgi:hypothetical protein
MRLAGQIFNASGGYIVGPRERPERCDTMAQRRKIVVALVHHVVGGRGRGRGVGTCQQLCQPAGRLAGVVVGA